jgi:chromate transport protein ChrA
MGEENYAAINREAIQKTPLLLGLSLLCLPAIFLMMLGLMMLLLFPESSNRWGFDMAEGTMPAAAAILIFCPIRFFSERRLLNT